MVPEVTARLRPRSGWESQDLGLAMARGLLGRLLWQWCVVLVPFWLLLGLVLRDSPWAFIWITWWLKPLYDRLPLFTLSRRLFGQETRLRDVLKELPRFIFKETWYFLTIGRMSFYRCFSMPVKILEGGSYRSYRRRVSVLLQQGDSTVMWVTLGWWLCSGLAVLGCWTLWESLTVNLEDSEDGPSWFRLMGQHFDYADHTQLWTGAILHLLAISLTEIFYVGAGFGLYLNSRSHLEGWDIEVSFRSLAARLREMDTTAVTTLAICFLACAGATQAATNSRAVISPTVELEMPRQVTAKSVQRTVKAVKAEPEFKIHSEEYTIYDDVSAPSGRGPDWNFDGLGAVVALLGWGSLAALIGLLVWLIYRYRHVFLTKPSQPTGELDTKARVVLGMEVTPEALPTNIPDAALQCWRAGDVRGALRLLYAGSLHWMIERARLPIRESDTEGDCLRHSSQLTEPLQRQYFQGLTELWMSHAYGRLLPEAAAMEQYIHQWPFRK
jgi:hypothetical protein